MAGLLDLLTAVAGAPQALGGLLGAMTPQRAPTAVGAAPVAPPAPGAMPPPAPGASPLPPSLVRSESGGNLAALNSEGYGGRGQFGDARLMDAYRAGVIPQPLTGAQYSQQPESVQAAVEAWHRNDILSQLGQYVGRDVDGPGPIPPLTPDSLLAVAHLGGTGGARRFIESGGRYDPADSNGTNLSDYAMMHAGGGSPAPVSGGGGNMSLLGGPAQDVPTGGLLGAAPPAPQRPPSMWDRLAGKPVIGGLANPDTRARLAIGLEGMTLSPNQGFMDAMQGGIDQRAQEEERARLAAWLASQPGGEQWANAIAYGIDPTAAFGGYVESQQPPAPVQPIEINGQLVDPTTGAVIGDYRDQTGGTAGYRQMTGADINAATGANLPADALYNVSPEGQLTPVGGGEADRPRIVTGADGQPYYEGGAPVLPNAQPAPGFRVMSPAEVTAAGLPPGSYQIGPDGRVDPIVDSGVTVNNNMAGETAFEKETGTLLAQQAAAVVDQGALAQRSLGQLITLESALANAPQGAAGGLGSLAAAVGIPFQGRSDLEVAQALIAQMVPGQRPPGAGTMSDADLALFQASLPALARTPDGNRQIIATMRSIAEYDIARARIAQDLQTGVIDQATANAQYSALGNPIPPTIRNAGGGSATAAPAPAPARAAAPSAPAPSAFLSNPQVQAAAQAQGVTPQAIWDVMDAQGRAVWGP